MKCFIQRYEREKNDQVQNLNTFVDIDVSYDFKRNVLKYDFHTIKKDEDLAFLEVKDHMLKYLPRNICDCYPYIVSITTENTELMEIRYENLRELESLRNLNLKANKIDALELNLFNDNPNLVHVNLQNNRLFDLDPKVFENIKLKNLNLDENICIDKSYDFRKDERQNMIQDLDEACKGFKNMKKHIDQKIQAEKELYQKKVDYISSREADLKTAETLLMEKIIEIESPKKELEKSLEKIESEYNELLASKNLMESIGLITIATCAYLIIDLSLSVACLLRNLHVSSFDQTWL